MKSYEEAMNICMGNKYRNDKKTYIVFSSAYTQVNFVTLYCCLCKDNSDTFHVCLSVSRSRWRSGWLSCWQHLPFAGKTSLCLGPFKELAKKTPKMGVGVFAVDGTAVPLAGLWTKSMLRNNPSYRRTRIQHWHKNLSYVNVLRVQYCFPFI